MAEVMTEVSVESIIEQVEHLPLKEQFEVTARLQKRALEMARQMSKGRFLGYHPYQGDHQEDYQWLREHHQDYADQWVALKDGQLLAHGSQLKEVLAAAEAQGVKAPLVSFIESSNDAMLF